MIGPGAYEQVAHSQAMNGDTASAMLTLNDARHRPG
jgi:hypothetical protein